MNSIKVETVPCALGYRARRPYTNKRGELRYEWLTQRGWRRVHGGGQQPSDCVIVRVRHGRGTANVEQKLP